MSDTLTASGAPAPAPADHDDYSGHATNTGISNPKLGMWVFLGSDCMLFGGLIATYMLYKNRPMAPGIVGNTQRISDAFDIAFTSASSFVLLMSSLTMVLAVTSIARGDHHRLRLWLGTTAFLGAIFIGGQVYEFTEFVREGFGYTTNVSASSFYTLTGFHGVHVTFGILMLLTVMVLSFKGRIPQSKAEGVEIVGLYWHFVDVVWILIFTVVYLIK